MTAEQEKQIQTAKLNDQRAAYTGGVMSASMRDRRNLITIIDDLQQQQPKRYTEAELREAFASQYQDGLHRDDKGKFASMELEAYYFAWFDCARFLGMIKTEGES